MSKHMRSIHKMSQRHESPRSFVSRDESLWHTVSLNGNFGGHSYMPVPVSFINHFLRNGCKNLQMMNLELVKNVTWEKNNLLKRLDLDNVVGMEEEHKLFSLKVN